MSKSIRIACLAAGLLLCCSFVFSQTRPQTQAAAASQLVAQENAASPAQPAEAGAARGDKPAEKVEEEEENAKFKYSSIVRGIAQKTGLPKEAVFWIFMILNFAILAGAGYWLLRKLMPHGFAPRKEGIRKALEEARRASADAGARLGEIESRLSRLDAEITEIRASAEADFTHEEQRIKADAEKDAKLVIAAAEQEISAAARAAQRELKVFAASLAVDLAEKKIKVDTGTDEALIRGFASRLGKDGHS